MERPLILVTNDDGVDSPGLWAAVEAVLPLGEVLVVAPDRQWSGAGRCIPNHVSGRVTSSTRRLLGKELPVYVLDATPALGVVVAVLRLAPRRPDLVVVGVNFGVNPSYDVTYSGTVGAALEAGAFGIPSIAVALEMDPAYHLIGESSADYTVSQALTQRLASHLLTHPPVPGVHAWNLNIPPQATVQTPWRLTRLSRHRYYRAIVPEPGSNDTEIRYRVLDDLSQVEQDSDVWALAVDRVVSLTPLSLDLTWRPPQAASLSFGGDAWDSLDRLVKARSD